MHPNRLSAFVAASLLAVTLAGALPAQAAGALVVGKCGAYGFYHDAENAGIAEEKALDACEGHGGEGCRVVYRLHGNCAALSVDSSRSCGPEGWATGSERGEAEDRAIRECINRSGGQCEVRAWVCDGG